MTNERDGARAAQRTTDLAARFEAQSTKFAEYAQQAYGCGDEVSSATMSAKSLAFAEARDMARADAAGGAGIGWRPIETAPKEQQPILLALDRGRYGDICRAPAIAFWSEKAGDWRHWNGEDVGLGVKPTHWRPLPAAPPPAQQGSLAPALGAGEGSGGVCPGKDYRPHSEGKNDYGSPETVTDGASAAKTITPHPQAPNTLSEVEEARAAADVLAERRRQVEAEGWTPAHDDAHGRGEICRAACSYAYEAGRTDQQRADCEGSAPPMWPWELSWWKPTERRRDLVKAGALILAEIERLDRATLRASQEQGGEVRS